MRVVKYQCLESVFNSKIHSVRDQQLKEANFSNAIVAICNGLSSTIPILAPLFSLVLYSLHNEMKASIIFPALMFSDYSAAVQIIQNTIVTYTTAKDALLEVEEFLSAEEHLSTIVFNPDSKNAISIVKVTWKHQSINEKDDSGFQLKNISCNILKGSFVGFYGPVGCGKSILLKGLLEQVEKVHGDVEINGTVAYCSQEPWLMAGSIKDNILFGCEYDEKKLFKVISDCCLRDDLNALPDGVDSELGDQGISLFGGQKSRIALARAIYSGSDIYLLDDPLSSCDFKVAATLLSKLKTALEGKTVILVTHSIYQLKSMDFVAVLKEGSLSEYVDIKTMLSSNIIGDLGKVANLKLDQDFGHIELADSNFSKVSTNKSSESKKNEYVLKEEKNEGSVKLDVYREYFRLFGMTNFIIFTVCLSFLVSGYVLSSYWLSLWTINSL